MIIFHWKSYFLILQLRQLWADYISLLSWCCFLFIKLLILSLMASVCNSLFAYHRTKTITWQGISATWWIRHLLWRTFWDEHSVGNRVSIWVHKRSSICWEYSESSCLSILGPFSVHSLVDSWLFVHDTFGVEGRPSYSCKATLLIRKLQ